MRLGSSSTSTSTASCRSTEGFSSLHAHRPTDSTLLHPYASRIFTRCCALFNSSTRTVSIASIQRCSYQRASTDSKQRIRRQFLLRCHKLHQSSHASSSQWRSVRVQIDRLLSCVARFSGWIRTIVDWIEKIGGGISCVAGFLVTKLALSCPVAAGSVCVPRCCARGRSAGRGGRSYKRMDPRSDREFARRCGDVRGLGLPILVAMVPLTRPLLPPRGPPAPCS